MKKKRKKINKESEPYYILTLNNENRKLTYFRIFLLAISMIIIFFLISGFSKLITNQPAEIILFYVFVLFLIVRDLCYGISSLLSNLFFVEKKY